MTSQQGRLEILLVMDNVQLAAELEVGLASLGLGVSGVGATIELALERVPQTQPDLVLMDLGLKNSLQAAEIVRRQMDLPVLFAGSAKQADIMAPLADEYPYGYVATPVETRDLETKIRMARYVAQAESALKEAQGAFDNLNREFQTIIDNIPTCIFSKDVHGRYTRVNHALMEKTGIPEKNWVGNTIAEVLPEYAEEFGRVDQQILDTGRPVYNILQKIETKTGPRWGRTTKIPHTDADGNVIGIIIFSEEVTDLKTTEKSLKKSEEQYRALVESTPDVVYTVTHDGIITYVSPAIKSLGYRPEEVQNQNFLEFIHPDQKEAVEQEYRRGHDHVDVTGAEFPFRMKNGHYLWMEAAGSNFFDREDRFRFQTGVLRNIAKRKALQEKLETAHQQLEHRVAERTAELHQAKLFLETLIEQLPAGILVADPPDGKIVLANQAAWRIIGYNPVENGHGDDLNLGHLPWKTRSLEGTEIPTMDRPLHRALFRGQITQNLELILCRPDGAQVPLLTNAAPVKDARGEIVSSVASFLDISEVKETAQALAASEQKYRSIVENATDALFTVNPQGFVMSWNKRAEEIFGYTQDEIVGSHINRLSPPEETERQQRLWKVLADAGMIHGRETIRMTKDGRRIPVEISSGVMKDAAGVATGYSAIIRDISKRKLLETQLQQARKMEAVGTLAGGIAHDFNNLLQVIDGYAQLMLIDLGEDSPHQENMLAIQQSVGRAAELVRQLLLFSRKADTERKPLALNQEIERARRLLERTIPKMIDIKLQSGSRLWTVTADPVQVEQMLLNLGSNAADAMPEGGELVIKTENVTLGSADIQHQVDTLPGNYVLLTVADTGMGMDDETVEHIFEPFFTTKEIGRGTGLGLASVYGIVKHHGGHIDCQSELGRGTSFQIYLPANASETDNDLTEQPESPVVTGTETLLIVDDEIQIRDFLARALARYGYSVRKAANGEEALELYQDPDHPIDLVILDIGMPGMGGYKCLQRLKQHDPAARVVVASGYTMEKQVSSLLDAGAMDFIPKPYRIKQLLSKIRTYLDG